MELKPLADEFVDDLLFPKPRTYTKITVCRVCKHHLDRDGQCTRYDCELYRKEKQEDFDCQYCGACTTPGKCVKSVTCPICFRPPKYPCINTKNGYHPERWQELNASNDR